MEKCSCWLALTLTCLMTACSAPPTTEKELLERLLFVSDARIGENGKLIVFIEIQGMKQHADLCFVPEQVGVELREVKTGYSLYENPEPYEPDGLDFDSTETISLGESWADEIELTPWPGAYLENSEGEYIGDYLVGAPIEIAVVVPAFRCKYRTYNTALKEQDFTDVWSEYIRVSGRTERFFSGS